MSMNYICNLQVHSLAGAIAIHELLRDTELAGGGLLADSTYTWTGNITLIGGQMDEEFAQELAEKIWKTLHAYVPVYVDMTYLNNLPVESFAFDLVDYKESQL